MHLIPFPVEFPQGRFEVLAYVGEDRSQVPPDLLGEDQPSRLRHKDPMHGWLKTPCLPVL